MRRYEEVEEDEEVAEVAEVAEVEEMEEEEVEVQCARALALRTFRRRTISRTVGLLLLAQLLVLVLVLLLVLLVLGVARARRRLLLLLVQLQLELVLLVLEQPLEPPLVRLGSSVVVVAAVRRAAASSAASSAASRRRRPSSKAKSQGPAKGGVGGAHLFFGAPPPRFNVREGKLGVTPTVCNKTPSFYSLPNSFNETCNVVGFSGVAAQRPVPGSRARRSRRRAARCPSRGRQARRLTSCRARRSSS